MLNGNRKTLILILVFAMTLASIRLGNVTHIAYADEPPTTTIEEGIEDTEGEAGEEGTEDVTAGEEGTSEGDTEVGGGQSYYNPAKDITSPKIFITGYNLQNEELFSEEHDLDYIGEFLFPVQKVFANLILGFVVADIHVYNSEYPEYILDYSNMMNDSATIKVNLKAMQTVMYIKVMYLPNTPPVIITPIPYEKESEDELAYKDDEIVNDNEVVHHIKDDTEEYNKAYHKLISNIPYTILKDSIIDWNKVTGLEDLEIEVDASTVGRKIMKVKLMGRVLEYDIEVVKLHEYDKKMTSISTEHWSSGYVMSVVEGGLIKGIPTEIDLESVATVEETFSAIDRLLLSKNIINMKYNRDIIENSISNNNYQVKSVISKSEDIKDIEANRPILREEIAQLIYYLMRDKLEADKGVSVKYYDIFEADNIKAIIFCTRAGVLEGYDNYVNPKDVLTIGELSAILYRLNNFLETEW